MIECVEALNDQGRDEGIFHSAFNSAFDPTPFLAKEAFKLFITATERVCRRDASESRAKSIAPLFFVSTPTKFTAKSSNLPLYLGQSASTFRLKRFYGVQLKDKGLLVVEGAPSGGSFSRSGHTLTMDLREAPV
jgi:hypothetical protein